MVAIWYESSLVSCEKWKSDISKGNQVFTNIDVWPGHQTLGEVSILIVAKSVSHTAACKDAYSTGTRIVKMASGGGFVQSRARASSSYDLEVRNQIRDWLERTHNVGGRQLESSVVSHQWSHTDFVARTCIPSG